MKRRLLQKLKPKKYLCPFCGNWHKWRMVNDSETIYLNFYSKQEFERWYEKRRDLGSLYMYSGSDCGSCQFYAYDDTLYCDVVKCWSYSSSDLKNKVKIEFIKEDFENARIIFEIKLPVRERCRDCLYSKKCSILKLNVVNDESKLYIPESSKKHSSDAYIIIPMVIQFDKEDFIKQILQVEKDENVNML